MKVLIELNPAEAKTAINSGTMLALIDAVDSTEQSAEKETKSSKAASVETKKPETEKNPDTKTENVEKPIEQDLQPESKEEKDQEPPVAFTLEQVRGKLASLSQSGKQAQVKALITKFGASKLTDIAKEDYAAIMKEAEMI